MKIILLTKMDRNIPKLDLNSTKKNKRQREKIKKKLSCSDNIHLSEKKEDLAQLLEQYNNLKSGIEDIKESLESATINSSTIELLNECIRELRFVKSHLYGIESSPRFLSRIDAVVGNSQVLLNRFDDTKKEIISDIEEHDKTVNGRIDGILEVQNSIMETQYKIEGIQLMLLNRLRNMEEILFEIDKEEDKSKYDSVANEDNVVKEDSVAKEIDIVSEDEKVAKEDIVKEVIHSIT